MDVREQPEGGRSESGYLNFSTLCRRLLSCIPLVCESRWTVYKSKNLKISVHPSRSDVLTSAFRDKQLRFAEKENSKGKLKLDSNNNSYD